MPVSDPPFLVATCLDCMSSLSPFDSFLLDLWRSMVSGPPIDEQGAERNRRSSTVPSPSGVCNKQACDSRDPNDFAPTVPTSTGYPPDPSDYFYDDDSE